MSLRPIEYCVSYLSLEREEQILEEALSIIKARTGAVSETILPDTDSTPTAPVMRPRELFTRETLGSIIHRLYNLFFDEYKIIIETNFPTLKGHFRLYSEMPVHFLVCVNSETDKNQIEIFECSKNGQGENEVTLCDYSEVETTQERMVVRVKGQSYRAQVVMSTSIDFFMRSSNQSVLVELPWQFLALRSMVYDRIARELPEALAALRSVSL